jgi:hypothetical protein
MVCVPCDCNAPLSLDTDHLPGDCYVCGDDCMAVYTKQKNAEDLAGKVVTGGQEPPKSAPKTNKKPRKPRDGLCVMCKTYLIDETLGDCHCCGDACVAAYIQKQKKGPVASAPEPGSTTQGGVKRKRRDPEAEVEDDEAPVCTCAFSHDCLVHNATQAEAVA